MRVYLPTTLAGLSRLAGSGGMGHDLPGFSVTDQLARWWADGGGVRADIEELEYAATVQAATASLQLLDATAVAGGTEPARRIVVVAEAAGFVAAEHVNVDESAPGAGTLPGPLLIADVVAVHVDTPDASAAVRTAVAALADAAAPTSHVDLVLDELADHQLAWYAPDEIGQVLARLHG